MAFLVALLVAFLDAARGAGFLAAGRAGAAAVCAKASDRNIGAN